MMLFLGAGASKSFGIKTLGEIEEEFNKTLKNMNPNEELFNGRFLYQTINSSIEQPSNFEDVLTVLHDLSKLPAHPTARYLYMILTRQIFDLYKREVGSYEKLINDLLTGDKDLSNARIDPKFLSHFIKMKINLSTGQSKTEDTDRPHGLEKANATELLAARRKELLELKKEASDRIRILTNDKLAGGLKSKILELIKEECSIEKITNFECSVKENIMRGYDRLFEILAKDSSAFNIFTTNYDTIIETYIETKGEVNEFYDGFAYSDSQREIGYWDPNGYGKDNYKIKLFKLHGSVDQYIDKDTIIKTPCESRKLEKSMLYPMREKEVYKDPFFELFGRLKKCLLSEKDKVCVVIGYSFRDEHIRNIFFDAVKRNQKLRIILIDKKPDKVMENLKPIKDNIMHPIKGEFGEEVVFEELKQKLGKV